MNAMIAILIAAISFSFYPLLNSMALETTSPFLLALLIQIVTIITATIALTLKIKAPQNITKAFMDYKKFPTSIFLIPVFSGIGIYLGGLFFIFSLSLMSKAGASLIMESWPVFAIFLAFLLPNKRRSPIRAIDIILIIITLIGMLMITASEKNISLSEFMNDPLFIFKEQDFYGYLGIVMAFLAAWCFATSAIARSYFAARMPTSFRIKYFGKTETITESIFTYLLTYILGLPLAVLSFLLFEDSIQISTDTALPVVLIGIVFVITSSLYSYAMLITRKTNINLMWYISPILAALWLAIFGYSQITEMLIAGGFLIVTANVLLILTAKKRANS